MMVKTLLFKKHFIEWCCCVKEDLPKNLILQMHSFKLINPFPVQSLNSTNLRSAVACGVSFFLDTQAFYLSII